MWVYDSVLDDKLYAYDSTTKRSDPSKDFDTLKAGGNTNPTSLWSDGTMWVANMANNLYTSTPIK